MPAKAKKLRTFRVGIVGYRQTPARLAEVKVKAPDAAAGQSSFYTRADPDALAQFDPETKRCTMNCGQAANDPRSFKECKFLCGDCETVSKPEARE